MSQKPPEPMIPKGFDGDTQKAEFDPSTHLETYERVHQDAMRLLDLDWTRRNAVLLNFLSTNEKFSLHIGLEIISHLMIPYKGRVEVSPAVMKRIREIAETEVYPRDVREEAAAELFHRRDPEARKIAEKILAQFPDPPKGGRGADLGMLIQEEEDQKERESRTVAKMTFALTNKGVVGSSDRDKPELQQAEGKVLDLLDLLGMSPKRTMNEIARLFEDDKLGLRNYLKEVANPLLDFLQILGSAYYGSKWLLVNRNNFTVHSVDADFTVQRVGQAVIESMTELDEEEVSQAYRDFHEYIHRVQRHLDENLRNK